MKHHSIFCQLLQLFGRYDFEKAVKETSAERHARGVRCWDQFVAMLFCHLASAKSLREITTGMASQEGLMYHLGARLMRRSSLSYANEHRPWQLYQVIFYQLLERCKVVRCGHKFRFKNVLMSIDATVIELCASIFDWARFCKTKGAIKLHLVLDHDGYLPTFAHITEGDINEIKVARDLVWAPGSIVVFDRGYLDFEWFGELCRRGVWFVSRAKANLNYRLVERLPVPQNRNILWDAVIELGWFYSHEGCPYRLRLIYAIDPDTGEGIRLLTNHLTFGATTISAVYKDRWQIELFFKALKQNLRVKTFVGTSANALHIQIWTALICYLLLWYLKARSRFSWSLSNLVALIRINLLIRRDLWDLLNHPFPPETKPVQNMLPLLGVG